MEAHGYAQAKKTNMMVLGALLVLTAITVAAAGVQFGSPSVSVIVALAIASVKATLVALFFMHLRHDRPINAIIFVVGIFMLALFLTFTLIDVDSRATPRPANLAPPSGGPAAAAETAETTEAP